MKFQKSLLAASLAVAAVSANAAHTWTDLNGNVHQQKAPIDSLNNYYAEALSQDTYFNAQTGETIAFDLGSKLPAITGGPSTLDPRTSIAKFKLDSGKEVVQIRRYVAGSNTPNTEYYTVGENAGQKTLDKMSGASVQAVQSQLTNENMTGGVITKWKGSQGTIEEIKRVNNETIKYGQITTTDSAAQIGFATIPSTLNADSEQEDFYLETTGQSNEKSVELGILQQKTVGDVTTNVYGVSAKDGSSVTTLTGSGVQTKNIVLANGDIQTVDGRVILDSKFEATGSKQNQHVREYNIDGEKVFAMTNVETNEVQYFKGKTTNGVVTDLVEFEGNEDLFLGVNLYAGGTASTSTGVVTTSSVRNVLNDKNLTYSEKVEKYETAGTIGNTTIEGVSGAVTVINTANQPVNKTSTEQSLVTGIIAQDADKNNVYGLEVKKSTTDASGETTSAKTTITADYVDSGDFRINGVSIVDNIKESVDGAVAGATEAIDAKIVEVDSRLTQFNTTAANLNSRVDQLNSRVDDVEKTAYRGVAIALAAQQQIPNIGAGQFAVFGGVGHYEGESAGALGVASVFADGRTSVSAALGFAGGNEVGGRVGLSYVFGGK